MDSRNWHLFEFMDLQAAPRSLKNILREILQMLSGAPFRLYLSWAARLVGQSISDDTKTIVELGAGMGSLTVHLAESVKQRIVPTDINPDEKTFGALKSRFSNVFPIYESIDFSVSHKWQPGTVAVLSSCFHHIPRAKRTQVLRTLVTDSDKVFIFEPLRRTVFSALFCLLALIPAFALPIVYWRRPGRFFRIFWCWIIPVAPFFFVWDGLVSCVRMSRKEDWKRHVDELALGGSVKFTYQESLFCQFVSIQKELP